MALGRRLGVENSETRAQLIEAAAQLIRDEGYAAVTARRLAEKFGLKRQIVHYYFGAIEDLLIAVMRREGEKVRAHLTRALSVNEPLRFIWERGGDANALVFEFAALAARRPAIAAELKRHTEEFRRLEVEAIERYLAQRGVKAKLSPSVAALIIHGVAQTLAVESGAGISDGHEETKRLVERWLTAFVERGDF